MCGVIAAPSRLACVHPGVRKGLGWTIAPTQAGHCKLGTVDGRFRTPLLIPNAGAE